MSIKLYQEIVQPFGLLSNYARLPFKIDGKEYENVTNYIYNNIFHSSLNVPISYDPLGTILKKIYKNDEYVFNNALILAMNERFKQDIDLHKRLVALSNYPSVVIDFVPSLLTLCNKVQTNPTFFKPLTANAILLDCEDEKKMCDVLNTRLIKCIMSRQQMKNQVFFDTRYGLLDIMAVNALFFRIKEILIGHTLTPAEEQNIDMKKWYDEELSRGSRHHTVQYQFLNSLKTINDLIPKIKKTFKEQIHARQIELFKDHLLDVALDYILESVYTDVQKEDYQKAKRQQILLYPSIAEKQKMLLYTRYNDGNLDHNIENRLTDIPSALMQDEQDDDVAEDIEDDTLLLRNKFFVVRRSDVLMPTHYSPIRIGNIEYGSAVEYAYAQLFKQLVPNGNENEIAAFCHNRPLEEIARDYHEMRHTFLTKRITTNTQTAIYEKFRKYQELRVLLYFTSDKNIQFDDPLDYVLGSSGLNVFADTLKTLRSLIRSQIIYGQTAILMKGFDGFTTDAVINAWFVSRIQDYAETLRLIHKKDVNVLCTIYNITPIDDLHISRNAISNPHIFTTNGIREGDIHIALYCIFVEFLQIKGGGIKAMIELYDLREPDRDKEELAYHVVADIFKKVQRQLYTGVTEDTFIDTILKRKCKTKTEYWWRVHRYVQIHDDQISFALPRPGWNEYDNSLLIYTSHDITWTPKVIAFSLSTLNRQAPVRNLNDAGISEDWRPIISRYISDGYMFVIFNSILWNSSKDELRRSLEFIIRKINLPLQLYMSTQNDMYRKPNIGMPNIFIEYFKTMNNRDRADKMIYVANTEIEQSFAQNASMEYITPDRFFPQNV